MFWLMILALCVVKIQGITREETEYFGTTGDPEGNTGLVGWVTIEHSGPHWLIESNNIPDHDTGEFPNPEPFVNPNPIRPQSIKYFVPKNPEIADTTTCLPGGPIGVAVNGIVMYNPWDNDGENAVEGDGAEVFDMCDGHPDEMGRYHYHRQPSSCLFDIREGEPSPIVGVALDGHAIYGPVDENGKLLERGDLDECHGRYRADGVYQYHTTAFFPYILGCFKGTPTRDINTGGEFCFKASDADENGNVPRPPRAVSSGNVPDQAPPQAPRPRRSSPPDDARIPVNLFQRKLPTRYREFLQKVIFRR